jgi:glycosyltransferase involved in cell wall biosynthesis
MTVRREASGSLRVCHLTSASADGEYFSALCRRLAVHGHDVSIGRLWKGKAASWSAGTAVHVFDLGVERRAELPAAVVRLARLLRRRRVDVVHGHLPDATIVALAAGRLAGTPVRVFTRHHFDENWALGTGAWALVDVAMARRASAVVVASHAVRNHMLWRERLRDVDIHVIPHGLDERSAPTDAAIAAARREFASNGAYLVGAMARLAPAKGLEYLLDGFARFAAERADARLVIVGAGDAAALRQRAVALGIGERVEFAGWRQDAAALMRSFDVFVHTPLTEAFGLVVIEAMAASRPVIATNVGGIPEIVDDGRTGLLVPPADAGAVAAALRSVSGHEIDVASMVAAAEAEVSRRYTADRMADAYERLYEELAVPTRPT